MAGLEGPLPHGAEQPTRAGVDWLNPLGILWAIVAVYFVGRLSIEHVLDVPPVWGGSPESERLALALAAVFCVSVVIGTWLVPGRPLVRLQFSTRGKGGAQMGALIVAGYLMAGLSAVLMLIASLGGVSQVIQHQAAWASQLKEMGLTPLYAASYLFILACVVLSCRALISGNHMRAGLWYLAVVALALLLGRRVMILFAGLPLLSTVHYHVKRLKWRQVLVLGASAFALFTAVLLLRLELNGNSAIEVVGTSLEYALYDALVITVDRAKDLASLDVSYFIRHPGEFWGANTGALFAQRLVGFQWLGGATPPTAVGTLWIYFGIPGLVCWGSVLGYVMGRIRLEAEGSPPAALLYGFVLFYWFDFLRNGDIVLELKMFMRNAVLLCAPLLCYYSVHVVSARRALHQGTWLERE